MADNSRSTKKKVSAFAVFHQAQQQQANTSTANSSSTKTLLFNQDKGKHEKKRKNADTPNKPKKIAKKLRMSLRAKGKGVAGKKTASAKEQTSAKETAREASSGDKNLAAGDNEEPAIYVQQGASTSSQDNKPIEDQDSTPAKSLQDLFDGTPHADSAVEAQRYFEWLINPIKADNFFSHLFERKPLLLRRHSPSYNEGLFSSSELDKILKENDIQFSRHLDVTSYSDGKRETHNPEGRALAPVVWDYYQTGCSIRMLNPQTYSQAVWRLNSTLQEYFGCLVGANVYLTPAGTQGFAPHYDDIEAFVIQLEGKKHWRLYKPRTDSETLPRFSSGNFQQKEIGKPILDTVLEPGDLLYFPRGIIHQANALEDTHSLHITLSTCQKNTWGDLLENLVPRALQVAMEEDVEFRHALPRDYLSYMGVASSDITHPKRLEFLKRVSQLMMKLAFYAPIDAAADQMATKFMHDAMPPVLTKEELSCSIFSSPTSCVAGVVSDQTQLTEDTEIKILRRSVIRLISDGDQVHVYHTLENARKYHGKEPQFVEVPVEVGPAIEHLINSYPEYITIGSLPLEEGEFKNKHVEVAQVLYEKGIIVTRTPLQPVSDEEDR